MIEFTRSTSKNVEWLKNMLSKFTLEGGVKLGVGAPKDILRLAKVAIWVPKPLHKAEVATLRLVRTPDCITLPPKKQD